MAKVLPALPFANFSGKFSRNEQIVMRTRNGRTHAYVITKPYTGPLADSRKQAVSLFSRAVAQCQSEMSDPERLAWWQERYSRYAKAAAKHTPRANSRFVGTNSDKFYSTLRGFIIASLSAQLKKSSTNHP